MRKQDLEMHSQEDAGIRFRRLFEAARDGILIINPSTGEIVEANPFMEELLGYTRAEFVGKQLYELGMYEDEAANRQAFTELQRKHYIRYEDRPLLTKSGATKSVEFVSNVYEEADHQIIQCNIRDTSGRYRAQELLKEHAAELEQKVRERTSDLMEANEQLQGFTSSVAHDLRQQIRNINVKASILVQDMGEELNEESRDHLRDVMMAARRLARLTDDLLTFARVGRQQPQYEHLDLSAMAEEIVASFRDSNQCQLPTHFTIEPHLKAYADSSLMRLVLENLLDNACKYSAKSEAPEILFGKDDRGFFVRDNGIGFDMAYVNKLFQPFERLAGSAYEGTGIGLASVKRIIERHGGSVFAEGSLGEGATFYFTLL